MGCRRRAQDIDIATNQDVVRSGKEEWPRVARPAGMVGADLEVTRHGAWLRMQAARVQLRDPMTSYFTRAGKSH